MQPDWCVPQAKGWLAGWLHSCRGSVAVDLDPSLLLPTTLANGQRRHNGAVELIRPPSLDSPWRLSEGNCDQETEGPSCGQTGTFRIAVFQPDSSPKGLSSNFRCAGVYPSQNASLFHSVLVASHRRTRSDPSSPPNHSARLRASNTNTHCRPPAQSCTDGAAAHTTMHQASIDRQKAASPVFHNVHSLPFCERCRRTQQEEYLLTCDGCQEIFRDPRIDVGALFSVARTWELGVQQNMDVVIGQMLVGRQVPVNDIDVVSGCSMIHFAAKSGAKNFGDDEKAAELVSHLILKGADPSVPCHELQMTPLMYVSGTVGASSVPRADGTHPAAVTARPIRWGSVLTCVGPTHPC